jgi:inosose dehydratase
MPDMVKIANAPVSYGAFEVTVGKHEGVPDADQVLDAVLAAGYAGIDLGPVGYLGLGAGLRDALGSRGLLLCGGYVEVDVTADGSQEAGLAELSSVCDQFDAVAGEAGTGGIDRVLLPRPTVALIGSPDAGERWARIRAVVGEVTGRCADRGYEAVLHNEVGTQLSAQDDIVAVLESTSASLCLDTGHLVAAGGDPLAILADWRDRVSHVHLKDSSSAGPFTDAMQLWEGDVFCPLGAGAGRVDEVLDALRADGYDGWIVIEQDVLPRTVEAYRKASDDQAANRVYLRERGW